MQAEQSVITESGQQTNKLVRTNMALTMMDVELDQALGMIMSRSAPGFFAGTQVFTNAGEAYRQLVGDRA